MISLRAATRILTLLVLTAGLSLSACADKKRDFAEVKEDPVDQLYATAKGHLDRREFALAATAFDEVDRQHPYSVWATKAQIMGAFAHYQNNKYDEAIIALDRFIQLHPGNRDIVYAHYLKGLSYYEQISDVGRDQKMTQLAMDNLKVVVKRFPESKYARDARLKIDLTRDHLAGKEMKIGRYYMRKYQYLAAMNRFKIVIQKFQTTTHVPEALFRLVETYTALGLPMEAQKVAAVLGHNFPGDPYYQDAYAIVKGVTLEPPDGEGGGGWFDWIPFVGPDKQPLPISRKPAPPEPAADGKSGGWFDWVPFIGGDKVEEPPPSGSDANSGAKSGTDSGGWFN